jgi:hypothetical protein
MISLQYRRMEKGLSDKNQAISNQFLKLHFPLINKCIFEIFLGIPLFQKSIFYQKFQKTDAAIVFTVYENPRVLKIESF